jgi:hypothetical protein
MSPFAAMTVGAPIAGEPSTACALFEGCRAKTCAPSARSCVHLNTSRASEEGKESCPFACATSRFSAPDPGSAEEEEPGESVEKLDGTGDVEMARRTAECALVAEGGDSVVCGVYERRREIVLCRKGGVRCEGVVRRAWAGKPFGREEDIAGGEERDAEAEAEADAETETDVEVEEGESVWTVEG